MEEPRSLPLMPVVAVALAIGALFRLWPALDLWIAGWFHDASEGFFNADSGFAWLIYQLSPLVMWGLVIAGILFLLVFIVAPARITLRRWRIALTLLIALALGPGLLVNAVFKDHWGRARPAQVTEFGGALRFSPPLVKADQCGRNCSFPAGHPSMLFLGFAVAAAFAGRRRRQIILAAASLGALSGLGRMMQGGHFFSDVLFSGFITYGAAWFAWYVTGPGSPASRVIAALGITFSAMLAALSWAVRRPSRHQWRRGWVFGFFLAAAFAAGVGGLDQVLASWFAGPGSQGWLQFMAVVSDLGRPLYWVVGLVVLFALATYLKGRAEFLSDRAFYALSTLTLAAACTYALSGALKFVVGRSRPSVWFGDGTATWGPFGLAHDWWSLPSAHAAMATALALTAARLAPRYGMIFIAPVVLVMTSRVWLTAHWFSDVIAGAVVGIVGARLVSHLMLKEPSLHDR